MPAETLRRSPGPVGSFVERFLGRSVLPAEKYLLAVVVVYGVVVSLRNPNFLTAATFFDVLRGSSGMAVLAIGVMVVMLSGGIDVSFAVIAVVSGYASMRLMVALGIDNLAFVVVVAMLVGLLLGAVNAALINVLGLPTLIVTLGTSSMFHGLMAITLGTNPFTNVMMPASIVEFGSANIITITGGANTYGLSVFVPVVAAVGIVTWFILYRTTLGRSIVALGNSQEAARRVGISVPWTKVFVYTYSGALSGLMGIMSFAEVKYANPVSLVGMEFMVIAAVVIGGVRLTGGKGTMLGVLLGITIVQLFQSTLVFLGIPSSWNNLFFAVVLLSSLVAIYYRQRKSDERQLNFTNNP